MLFTRIAATFAFVTIVVLIMALYIPELNDVDIPTSTSDTPLDTPVTISTNLPLSTEVPLAPQAKLKRMIVTIPSLFVRENPSLNSRPIKGLLEGDFIELLEPLEVVEADEHIWVKHKLGWSAVRNLTGRVFLEEAND